MQKSENARLTTNKLAVLRSSFALVNKLIDGSKIAQVIKQVYCVK